MPIEAAHVFPNAPHKYLLQIFCAWKLLLLVLATFCPGPGYDTSALILLDNSARRHDNFEQLSWTNQLVLNSFRWDAIYFVKAAERNKIHEQEWAFSWAYSHLLRVTAQFVGGCELCPLQYYILAGVVISNICHVSSVFVLYHLVTLVVERPHSRQIAFVASVLHVLTPAGLFLSAPYAEALFSLLNFSGMLLYAQMKINRPLASSSVVDDIKILTSGALFASACLVRSNGLLSGLLFLYDLTEQLLGLMSAPLRLQDCRRIVVTCVAGLTIMLGFVAPQAIAFKEFCAGPSNHPRRPWCEKTVPSIYSWVQEHYWNVGLFRYWTVSNLPLFIMAAPMLWILVHSSLDVLRPAFTQMLHRRSVPPSRTKSHLQGSALGKYKLPELAVPQLVLALMAFMTFHVQIVNRIASGYPTWYITMAVNMVGTQTSIPELKTILANDRFVKGMVIYGIIQGVLFANFLPPA